MNEPGNITETLKSVFGFSEFRGGQEQCINQIVAGESSLAVFPTGSGKSLCYQLSALHLPHLTLVVSPLLALMKDQLDYLHSVGVKAASLDSSLSPPEYSKIVRDVKEHRLKILMVSVERFKNERFRQMIANIPISMLVVDEAHCISEWGHNFRPDYLKLPAYRQQLNIPTVLLLTATATRKVKRDMAEKFNIQRDHIVQTGFYRANLDLNVLSVADVDKNNRLLEFVGAHQGAGIVYVTLQNSAEKVAEFLRSKGCSARAYHAGLNSDLRVSIQNEFMNDQVDIVVATIAFGMGVDKSNIRYVVHYDLPKSIENYSQEIGRAGRDGDKSHCLTFANLDGINTVENFIYGDTPEFLNVKQVIQTIERNTENNQWHVQVNSLASATNIRQLPLKTLLVQLELSGVIEPLFSYYADFQFKFIEDEQTLVNRFDPERRSFLEAVFSGCERKKIWNRVNFETIHQNTNSERSRVVTALEYMHENNWIELQTKQMTEAFRVNTPALTQEGLAENLTEYFKEKENSEIARVAALVRFFELDKCLSSNLARYFDDQNVPEVCDHCSVCAGHVATLKNHQSTQLPESFAIEAGIGNLSSHIEQKMSVEKARELVTAELVTKFLIGITSPVLTKVRAKNIEGYGQYASIRFMDIKMLVEGQMKVLER